MDLDGIAHAGAAAPAVAWAQRAEVTGHALPSLAGRRGHRCSTVRAGRCW
ncbi:MAG: hypothetical protein ACJ74U_04615 [Jatrophihabitantaceae bacterium]